MDNRRSPRCPSCGAVASVEFRPFCSSRCRSVDLGRWLDGRYVIAGEGASSSVVSGTAGAWREDEANRQTEEPA